MGKLKHASKPALHTHPTEISTPLAARLNRSQFILGLPKSPIHLLPTSGQQNSRATNFRPAAHQPHLEQIYFSTITMLQSTGRDQPHPHQGHATSAA
ncbi:hypothetical protein Nepgr_033705 [Nepenthes gracilis]|uniref:Uncharacterized protein n=1 Tax=Nepenthes gracilis TaxID=150966 RepID=A0AAD3Y936_NEPGR|nr:hypothetical protein Nepgr_033705 [Nepenthes gracilis]